MEPSPWEHAGGRFGWLFPGERKSDWALSRERASLALRRRCLVWLGFAPCIVLVVGIFLPQNFRGLASHAFAGSILVVGMYALSGAPVYLLGDDGIVRAVPGVGGGGSGAGRGGVELWARRPKAWLGLLLCEGPS